MSKYIRTFAAPLSLSLALVLGACGGKQDDTLAADSALNRDLAMAGRDTTAQPQLQDVPAIPPAAAPAPATKAPARTTRTTTGSTANRTPPVTKTPSGNTVETNTSTAAKAASGGGAVGTIASGTSLSLTANSRVCTNTHKVGDEFTASLASAVAGSDGATIPAGSSVRLRVTEMNRSDNMNQPVVVGLAVQSVTIDGKTYAISGSVDASVDRVRNQPKGKDVQKVVGGAVLGAIAGQVLGKDTKGTVIGAAAGAAAGTAAAAATANYEGCIPSGGRVTVTLSSPVQVRL